MLNNIAEDQTPRVGNVVVWDGWSDENDPSTWESTGTAKWELADGTWLVELDEAGVGDDDVTFPLSQIRWLA